MRPKIFYYIALLSFICTASSQAKLISLQSRFLTLAFETDPSLVLTELRPTNSTSNSISIIERKPIWQIVWIDQQNIQHLLTSNSAAQRDYQYEIAGSTQEISYTWTNLVLGEGKATVRTSIILDLTSGLSQWGLSIDWSDPEIIPLRVDFPMIQGISRGSSREDYLAIPFYWGRLVKNPIDRLDELKLTYPSQASMQFLTYSTDKGNVYLAAYDSEVWMKGMVWKSDSKHQRGSIYLEHFPPFQPTKHYEIPYPIIIGTYEGNWYNAALLYREWATQQRWCQAGRLAQRRDIPQWFREVSLWLKYYNEPGKVLSELVDHYSFVGVPTALFYYRYPVSAFDDNYPEFLPARRGFLESIQDIHRIGSHVMPYTSGSVWDIDTRSWIVDGAAGGAVVKNDGAISDWEYHGTHFAHMCPASPLWQEKIVDLTKKLVLDYDTDGVYLDLMASTPAKACWSANHEHPKNGGRYWGEGTRNLMDRLRSEIRPIKPDATFTTEEVNEAYIDVYDGFLALDITRGANEPPFSFIPLFSAVYHDYAILFGSDAKLSEDADHFSALIAANFIQGSKPTLSEFFPPKIRERPDHAAYLKNLVTCYDEVGKEYLLDGEWLPPPDIRVDSTGIPIRWNQEILVPFPSIQGSLWRAPDGDIGLFLTNWTSQPKEFDLQLDRSTYGPSDRKVYLRTIWPKEQSSVFELENPIWKVHDYLPPRSLRVIEISDKLDRPAEMREEYPGSPYIVIQRSEGGKFLIPPAGRGYTWLSDGRALKISDSGEITVEGSVPKQDFLLLEKVAIGTRPEPIIASRTDSNEISRLAALSEDFRLTCQWELHERRPQFPKGRPDWAPLMDDIFLKTGMRLSILPPEHDRLIPGIPLDITCRLSAVSRGGFLFRDLQLHAVQPISMGPHLLIERKEPENVGNGGQGEIIVPFRLLASDLRVAEHAITLCAEARVSWQGEDFTLIDRMTIPCDLPLMADFVTDRNRAWLDHSPFPAILTVGNISDYPLSVVIKPILPQGWTSHPKGDINLPANGTRNRSTEQTVELILTPAADTPLDTISLSFDVVYNSLSDFPIRKRLSGQMIPPLVPPTDRLWPKISPTDDHDLNIRKRGRVFLYMNEGESAEIRMTNSRLASYSDPVRFSVFNPENRKMIHGEIPFNQSKSFRVNATTTGTYLIHFEPGQNACIVETDHRYAVLEASSYQPLHLFRSDQTLYFHVPDGAQEFILRITCGGEFEPVSIEVFNPDGYIVCNIENQLMSRGELPVRVPAEYAGQVWGMRVIPKEDVSLELIGDVVPFVADRPEKILTFKEQK